MMIAVSEAVGVLVGLLVVVLIYSVFGVVCALIAPSRGRSPVGWFFIGVVTQCIGIILILLLPNLKEEEAKEKRRRAETRKLRELLKKERQVSDHRHGAHDERLGAHDRALGVDTSSAGDPALLGPGQDRGDAAQWSGSGPGPGPGPGPAPAGGAGADPGEQWYYALDGEQRGPVPRAKLWLLWRDGRIDAETLVWRSGLAEWVAIREVDEMAGDGRATDGADDED